MSGCGFPWRQLKASVMKSWCKSLPLWTNDWVWTSEGEILVFLKSQLYFRLLADELKTREHQVTEVVTQNWYMCISVLLGKHSAYQTVCWKISCLINQKIMAAKSLRKNLSWGRQVVCGPTVNPIIINLLSFKEFLGQPQTQTWQKAGLKINCTWAYDILVVCSALGMCVIIGPDN